MLIIGEGGGMRRERGARRDKRGSENENEHGSKSMSDNNIDYLHVAILVVLVVPERNSTVTCLFDFALHILD